jgi:uncharacterized DUF497 family protein
MKKVIIFITLLLTVVSHSFAGGDPTKANATDTHTKQKTDRLAAIAMLDKTLQTAINTPPPNTLTKEQLDEYRKQTQWFIKLRKKYDDHKTALNTMKQGVTLEAHMAQMNMQFLALQEATQMESRKFQTLSNASKARHDIALNAIRNMK